LSSNEGVGLVCSSSLPGSYNMKTIILAYPGAGKTYVAENYVGFADFEHQDFIYIYDESIRHLPLDQRKGNTEFRGPNPEWPGNYFAAAMGEFQKGNILIAPFVEPVFEAFDSAEFKALAGSRDVRIILVMPSEENFDEFEARYRARGNGENFIKRRRDDLLVLRELFNNASAYDRTLLSRGQFLDDAIAKHGIELIKI